ncbi:MAG: microcin ABC transporter permease [Rhodospirillaceae bacterium TMED8]|nr:microcin ABC transporter permease [Magnetovibrio sp.]OUT53247.1 MAG: microcin ABC transporter permease [Rhodospirillaceae bacterium TMED8]
MYAYILRRLLLIIPTLVGIMVINFAIIQFVPGGPVEQMIAQISGEVVDATARVGGQAGQETTSSTQTKTSAEKTGGGASRYRGAQGLPPELIEQLEKQFGLDKPLHKRFILMMENYIFFDFGDSYFQDRSVTQLVIDKMPVSISLGLWTTLLVYLISVPLGVAKAVRDGSKFDIWTSSVVIFGNAVPGFLFAILLIVLFAGGRYFDWFPLRGLTSSNFENLSLISQIKDYFWHMTLPVISMVIGGFAGLTMLTKNSFIEEINKQYVVTARSKGLANKKILYGHIFRNAMLIVIAGFPSAFVGILFTGALLTEVIFSLDGLGLLGFEAVVKRDYPLMFGTLYFFTLLGLLLGIIGDIMYHIIDPRIDFEARDV